MFRYALHVCIRIIITLKYAVRSHMPIQII